MSVQTLDHLAVGDIPDPDDSLLGVGLKQKRFFHFREKRKLSENEQVFAKFRFCETFREKFR
jgi:hypothetical protein